MHPIKTWELWCWNIECPDHGKTGEGNIVFKEAYGNNPKSLELVLKFDIQLITGLPVNEWKGSHHRLPSHFEYGRFTPWVTHQLYERFTP